MSESVSQVQPRTEPLICFWSGATERARRFDTFSRPFFREGNFVPPNYQSLGKRPVSNLGGGGPRRQTGAPNVVLNFRHVASFGNHSATEAKVMPNFALLTA